MADAIIESNQGESFAEAEETAAVEETEEAIEEDAE
jgi:hypothetical protein